MKIMQMWVTVFPILIYFQRHNTYQLVSLMYSTPQLKNIDIIVYLKDYVNFFEENFHLFNEDTSFLQVDHCAHTAEKPIKLSQMHL